MSKQYEGGNVAKSRGDTDSIVTQHRTRWRLPRVFRMRAANDGLLTLGKRRTVQRQSFDAKHAP